MITNLPNQIPRAEIITGISDHDIVFVELNIAPTKLKQKPRNIPIYRKANWETMKTESDTLYNDMTGVVSTSSAEDMWIDFKTKLENIVKHHIPFQKLSAKIKPPWITHDTKKLMKKRDIKLYKTMKKSGSKQQRDNYKQIKHQVQKELRQLYWKYIEHLVTPNEDGSSLNSMKKFRSYIKSKNTDYNSRASLKHEGKLITDTKLKASVLSEQFQSVFSEPSRATTQKFKEQNYLETTKKYPIMPDIHITNHGIAKLLSNLDPSTAADPDELKPQILKELADNISPVLCLIFNKSLETGVVPTDWRTAHVSPIYKKGSKYSPENYRPISLTCICCKFLEHVVVRAIITHADKHNILYPLQHGFRKNRSCETQLLELIDDVTKYMANSVQTDVLIMDFSKAFDEVRHYLLTHKLNYYRIQGKTNTWIHIFLSNRTQTVLLEDYITVMNGAPQGSVLAPSLFLYCINDIPDGITLTVRLLADNTIAYLTIKSNRDCTTLQNDLDKFSIWEQKWKMTYHPDKCNVLSITRHKAPVKHINTLHGHQLEHADKAKYLGVTIQSDLKWDSHINNIKTKANKTLGLLRRNINISSTKVKEQAYKSLVRPSLE
jgi:hypothetical protein